MNYPKNRKSPFRDLHEKAVKLYLSGMTPKQVAKIIGCSSRMVTYWAEQKGVNRSMSAALKLSKVKPPSQKGRKRSFATRRKITYNQIGSKSWRWKGGISRLQERIRHGATYADWRLKVLKRDNFTCQKCGVRSFSQKKTPLNVHHINTTFFEILEKFNVTSVKDALKCEALWDVSNGITLCKKCHENLDHHIPFKKSRLKEVLKPWEWQPKITFFLVEEKNRMALEINRGYRDYCLKA